MSDGETRKSSEAAPTEAPREPKASPRWAAALQREAEAFARYKDPGARRDAVILGRAAKLVRSEREARLILEALGWDTDAAAERVLREEEEESRGPSADDSSRRGGQSPRAQRLLGYAEGLRDGMDVSGVDLLKEEATMAFARDVVGRLLRRQRIPAYAQAGDGLRVAVEVVCEAAGIPEPTPEGAASSPSPGDAAAHELDVAAIRQALEADADVSAAIDWPAFWQRRAQLGQAAEAIEEPVRATVEWMRQEGAEEPDGLDLTPRHERDLQARAGARAADPPTRREPSSRPAPLLVSAIQSHLDALRASNAPIQPSPPKVTYDPATKRIHARIQMGFPIPVPPEPDDEPSRYDAAVAERMSHGVARHNLTNSGEPTVHHNVPHAVGPMSDPSQRGGR